LFLGPGSTNTAQNGDGSKAYSWFMATHDLSRRDTGRAHERL